METEPATSWELATERLRLRPVAASDAPAMFEIRSDPEVTAGYGQEPHRSVEETATWIERCVESRGQGEDIVWAIAWNGSGVAIGSCCLWNFDKGRTRAELGYELGRAWWGRGIMPEAVAAVLAHGFASLGLNRIEATPLAANGPSRSLLRRLGFRYEGRSRQRHLFRGRFVDQCLYGLLRGEWAARNGQGEAIGPNDRGEVL